MRCISTFTAVLNASGETAHPRRNGCSISAVAVRNLARNTQEAYLKYRKDKEPTINSKVRYIQKRADNRKHILNKYFSDDLLDNILTWKDERNRLIHALLLQQLAHNEVRELAEQGNELVRILRSRSGAMNRAIEKQKNP